jgi:SAM-dependent methyltransferase
MTQGRSIIDLPLWLRTPPGRFLLDWERARIEAHVADVFGFHALQLGLGELDALQANRMPHRWLALPVVPGDPPAGVVVGPQDSVVPGAGPRRAPSLSCDFDALPFPSQSVDLVVLPHTLELAADPHQTLREVERVLVPEGRLVVLGFNPTSLWGARQWSGRWARRVGLLHADARPYLPCASEPIGHRRLRDWLRLLGFEIEGGGFGCYRPALRSQAWFERWAWMEQAGDRWWPVFGAVYLVSAVKRVRGMRLIGPAWKKTRKPRAAPAVVSRKHPREPALDAARREAVHESSGPDA